MEMYRAPVDLSQKALVPIDLFLSGECFFVVDVIIRQNHTLIIYFVATWLPRLISCETQNNRMISEAFLRVAGRWEGGFFLVNAQIFMFGSRRAFFRFWTQPLLLAWVFCTGCSRMYSVHPF